MYVTTSTLTELAGKFSNLGNGLIDVAASIETSEWLQSRQAWYTLLLKQTLDHAEQTVPFYRKRIEQGTPNSSHFSRLSDLAKFPVLSKTDIITDIASFISESAVPENLHCTSGTTARRLNIYGNHDEELAKAALRKLQRTQLSDTQGTIVLRLVPSPRRLFAVEPPASDMFTLSVGYTCNQIFYQWFDATDYLVQVLNDTYLLKGHPSKISTFHVTPPWMIEYITEQLRIRGIKPSEFNLIHVALSGGFSNSRIRRIIEREWNANYYSSYSCSEIGSEALESSIHPGVFHPSASLYCEIIDVKTYEPVQLGEAGFVVLTSLYPFQQVMPFIRYNTGDIAQRVALPLDNGLFVTAFRPIGRIQHCLQTGPRKFLGTREVGEALAHFCEIPQIPYPRHELCLERLDKGKLLIRLKVESTEIKESCIKSVQSEISDALAKEYAFETYNESSDELLFECELYPKGSLRNFYQLYADR